MESFKAKVGPLPVWAWGLVVAGGAAAVFWWRQRGASDTSSTDSSGLYDNSYVADQAAALGYLGYGEFAGAGQGSTGLGTDTGTGGSTGGNTGTGTGTGSTGNPHKAPGNCRIARDPGGNLRHICGFGHWFKKIGSPHWYWTPGPIPAKGVHNPRQYRPGPPLVGGGTIPLNSISQMGAGGTQQPRDLTGAAAASRAVG